jgi:S-adenosylmethionine/arginine decarboxylase-like enzyme
MLEHKHLIVRAEVESPPFDEAQIVEWLKKLVDDLGMKVMMGPFAAYSPMIGNRGLTAAVLIETSHIVLHAWDEENPAMLQLDVYSCSEVDPQVVWDAISAFKPVHVDYKFLDRKSKFIELL